MTKSGGVRSALVGSYLGPDYLSPDLSSERRISRLKALSELSSHSAILLSSFPRFIQLSCSLRASRVSLLCVAVGSVLVDFVNKSSKAVSSRSLGCFSRFEYGQ